MKWVEVIQIRSIGKNRKQLEFKLKELIDELGREIKNQMIITYRHVLIDTDFSIHLFHDSKKVENNGSQLGILIVNILKEFGLVNHSVWIEMDTRE